MKRTIPSLLFCLSLLLSLSLTFAGCGGTAGDTAGNVSTDGSALSASAQKDVETLRLIPTLPEEAIAPVKQSYPDEIQAILDEYYQKMLKEFPSWRQIPREMLLEVYDERNGGVNVAFWFCLGGVDTDCVCTYYSHSSLSADGTPIGGWTIYEAEGCKKFYASGVTQAQMDYIRDRLAAQIEEMIEEKGLIEREPVPETIHPYWVERGGELFVTAEYIASIPNPPEDLKGCGIDHEHLFGRILLE